MERRATLIAPLLALGVLCSLYSVWWVTFAHILNQRLDAMMLSSPPQPDGRWHCGARRTSGFPLRLQETLSDVSFEDQQGHALKSSTVILRAAPWAFTHLSFEAPEEVLLLTQTQPATAKGAGSRGAVFKLRAAGVEGSADFSLSTQALTVRLATGALHFGSGSDVPALGALKAAGLSFEGHRAARSPVTGADPAWDMAFTLKETELPPLAAFFLPLESRIEEISLTAAMKGPFPSPRSRDGLMNWQKSGGTLEFSKLGLTWGKFALAGSGTFTLDETLSSQFAASFQAMGLRSVLQKTVSKGLLSKVDAEKALARLSRLEEESTHLDPPPPAGTLVVPLTLDHGTLTLAGETFPLPPHMLDWNTP